MTKENVFQNAGDKLPQVKTSRVPKVKTSRMPEVKTSKGLGYPNKKKSKRRMF